MVFVMVHTPWPTSKGFDHSYLHVNTRLLLCFMLVLASLVLGFAMFGALCGLDLVWLHPKLMRPCSNVTIWEESSDARLFRTYPSLSALCDDMLAVLVCAIHWLSMHLYTFAYMSMHESCLLVWHPCFNTMKLWTFNPNLHLSLVDTNFVGLFAYLSSFLFACFLLPLLAISIMLICFMPLSYALCIFFLPLLFCRFFVFAFACTHMERGHMELGHGLLGASKNGEDVSKWI